MAQGKQGKLRVKGLSAKVVMKGVSKHLTLSSLAVTLLEIASMLSPVYAILNKQGWIPEMKHRWILTELVGQLISSIHRIDDKRVRKIMEGILCPYRSTMKMRIDT